MLFVFILAKTAPTLCERGLDGDEYKYLKHKWTSVVMRVNDPKIDMLINNLNWQKF